VASQADDVGAKLFGGKLGRRPGKADQLRRREELTGPPREEGQQFRLATGKRQLPPRIGEHAPPNVEVEAGEIPGVVVARINLSPRFMRELIDAMQDNYSKWTTTEGIMNLPEYGADPDDDEE